MIASHSKSLEVYYAVREGFRVPRGESIESWCAKRMRGWEGRRRLAACAILYGPDTGTMSREDANWLRMHRANALLRALPSPLRDIP
jgi:hypothetical protein